MVNDIRPGRPIGTAVQTDKYTPVGVIGGVYRERDGNVSIRFGSTLKPSEGSGWTETEPRIVLTPEERAKPINALNDPQ